MKFSAIEILHYIVVLLICIVGLTRLFILHLGTFIAVLSTVCGGFDQEFMVFTTYCLIFHGSTQLHFKN